MMARIIILLCFSISCVFNISQAQMQVAMKGGINTLSFHDEQTFNFDQSRMGWHAGLDLRVGDGFFVKPGIHYHSFTSRKIPVMDPFQIYDETQIQFFKVPMNIGVRLTKEEKLFEMHVHGGLVTNIFFEVKEKNPAFDYKTVYGSNFGANLGFVMDLSIYTLGIQYEHGLTKMSRDHEGKNNVMLVSIGVVL